MTDTTVIIDYTNRRNERRLLRIIPHKLIFYRNEWHPQEQWMLVATDTETGEERYFAMAGIHSWRAA